MTIEKKHSSFFMRKKSILPLEYAVRSRKKKVIWQLAKEDYIPLVRALSEEILASGDMVHKMIIKDGNHSSLIRYHYGKESRLNDVFIKAFEVSRAKDRIRTVLGRTHKVYGDRFGRGECRNLILAQHKSIPSPAILAFGEIKWFGLPVREIVILEGLWDHITLTNELRGHLITESKKIASLERAKKLLLALFKASAFHIDLNSDNILLSPTGSYDDRLIDFEYCYYFERRSIQTLAFNLGYLYQKWLGSLVDDNFFDFWAYNTIKECSKSVDELNCAFRFACDAKQLIWSRRKRIKFGMTIMGDKSAGKYFVS
jgi:hypothetical protein